MSALTGRWHNEHGSELDLVVDPRGVIEGRFRTGVGFGTDETFEVKGRVAGDLVAFTVCFEKYGAITSWVGHIVPSEERIETLWNMTVELPHPKRTDELWKGVWSGADVFRRGSASAAKVKRPPAMPLFSA